MKIYIATDHAGFELKNRLKEFLQSNNYDVEDCGALVFDSLDDYPDFILPAAKKVSENKNSKGIILGGSGQGEAMAANRIKGVRAIVYYGGPKEIVKLSRMHNNANIISFGARFVSFEQAVEVLKIWLSEEFEGGRHEARINKLDV
ncbi:MAG: RpiB/LacA/LacB family sugar-phosphate isomerase [Candidatus Neomarinimicrobiota bacterium]|nr:RpiB/LacA/LacB family sugar-phosphate isomerase [Candidatus Neomarinimicrobiota bacterium]|tara:strand:+ start:1566 stop:2003 length:438 start_codon:yes stop_codon:yes gene_type:complete